MEKENLTLERDMCIYRCVQGKYQTQYFVYFICMNVCNIVLSCSKSFGCENCPNPLFNLQKIAGFSTNHDTHFLYCNPK